MSVVYKGAAFPKVHLSLHLEPKAILHQEKNSRMVLCVGPRNAVFKNTFYLYLYSMATLLVFKFIQSLATPSAFGRGRCCDLASYHHLILEVELRLYFSRTLLPKVSFAIQQ